MTVNPGLSKEDRENIEIIDQCGFHGETTLELIKVYCDCRLKGKTPNQAHEGVIQSMQGRLTIRLEPQPVPG